MAQPHPFINVLTPTLSGAGSKKSFSRFNDNGRLLWQSPRLSGVIRRPEPGVRWTVTEACLWHRDAHHLWHRSQASGVQSRGLNLQGGFTHDIFEFSNEQSIYGILCDTLQQEERREGALSSKLWPHVNKCGESSRHHLAWALCLNKHHPSTKL